MSNSQVAATISFVSSDRIKIALGRICWWIQWTALEYSSLDRNSELRVLNIAQHLGSMESMKIYVV